MHARLCQPKTPCHIYLAEREQRENSVSAVWKRLNAHSLSCSWKYNHLHVYVCTFFFFFPRPSRTNTHTHKHTPAHTCMPLTQTHRHKPHNKSQTLADHTALSCGENKGYSYPSQWEVCTANSLSPSLPRLSPQLFITDNLHSQTFHFSAIVRFLIIFISP